MIDPLLQKILTGTVIYGILMLYAGGLFQVYRRERKSAAVLLSLATTLFCIWIGLRILRGGLG